MASHPNPPATNHDLDPELDEKPLSYEEGWALFWSLEGSMQGWFPSEGGPSDVLRKEREAWGE